ncbi:hypothetical protein [Leucobacter luti]|uniref:hypothetical protein n=1 Tax=Leucobacter luti TaxID=340320 RepID=UPI003CFDF786
MDKNEAQDRGLRMEIPQGTDEGVAVDELVDDLLRGDVRAALRALHEPSPEEASSPGEAQAPLGTLPPADPAVEA